MPSGAQDLAVDPGLLGDLADRRSARGSRRPRCGPWAATTAAGRAGRAARSARPAPGRAVVDHQATGGGLVDRAQPTAAAPVAAPGLVPPERPVDGDMHAIVVASPVCWPLQRRSRSGTGVRYRYAAGRARSNPPTVRRRARRMPSWSCSGSPRVADELAARFTAAAGHRLHLVGGPVRDALLGRLGNDLDFTTDARAGAGLELAAGWADAVWDTGIAFGTVGAERGRASAGDHHLPGRPLRPGSPQPRGGLRRLPRRTTCRGATSPSTRWPSRWPDQAVRRPVRRPGRAARPGAGHPGHRRRSPSPTTRCGCCARPGSSPSSASPSRPRGPAAHDVDGRPRSPDHRGAGAGRAVQAAAAARTRGRAGAAGGHRAGRARAARAAGAAAGDRRAPPAQGRLRALADGAGPGDRAGGPDGPDLVLRLAALLHDIGKPATRRHEPGGGVSFHHHEVVGAKLVRKRLRGAAVPQGRRRGRRRS